MAAAAAPSLVEGLRASLEDDRKKATERWEEADKALSKALRDKKKEASQPPKEPIVRRALPLQWDPPRERGLAGGSLEIGCSTSSWPGAASGMGSGSEDDAEAAELLRASRISAARQAAFEERAKRLRRRADDSKTQAVEHQRRKLRVKVAGILREVRRRQELQLTQEKARQHREACLRGSGRASLVQVGEASLSALGLPPGSGLGAQGGDEKASGARHCDAARAAGVHPHVISEALQPRGGRRQEQRTVAVPPGQSPRRVALLQSLTLDELDLLRRNTLFFFEGPVLSSLCTSTLESEGSTEMAEVRSQLEPLADFFTPAKDEKSFPVSAYASKLRSQIQLKEEPQAGSDAESPNASLFSVTGKGSIESLQTPSDWNPSDRMPSQGRRPAVREDHLSPTYAKVREVYNRRDAADAKWVAEREEAMVRREAINAFKAAEQQREWQLEIFKQKELHKVRMLEAEERKAMIDSEQAERTERLEASKANRLRAAALKAEDAVEERRDKAAATLDDWAKGIERCERHSRERERNAIARAETKWGKYMARLWSLGMERHDTRESQFHKSDMLKSKIQSSLRAQIKERRVEESAALAEVLKAKQEAAAERRTKLKSQYNFLEQAFGSQAAAFDAKYHWGTVDRRSESWRKSSEAWSTQSKSFSEPSLALKR